jgi:uncharacterized protein YutE (UPF0331/DUF86 family)
MSPGQVDSALVRRHLLALDTFVSQLRKHAGKPVAALHDRDEAWAVERGLQLCVQNCLDIATHLSAAFGRDVPDYAAAIDTLSDLGVLPAEFSKQFRAVAGLRNILVHGYLSVDEARVHAALNERLDDFTAFAEHVEAFLVRDSAEK